MVISVIQREVCFIVSPADFFRLMLHRLNENPSIGRKVAHHSGEISGSESSEGSGDENVNNGMQGPRSLRSSSARLSTSSVSAASRSSTPLFHASRSSTPLSHSSRATTHSPHPATTPLYSQPDPSQSPAPSQGLTLETSNGSQYSPGVPFPIHKKVRSSRTPSSSSIDPATLHGLISNSSQMVMLMAKSTQERLDLMKQWKERMAEQHRSQVFAQQAQTYQQIISDKNLPDEVRNEAHQALMKLLRSN